MNDKATGTPSETPSSDEDMRAEYDFSDARKNPFIRTIYENNRQKPPFVPNSAKSGFLSSYFRSKEPCGSLFRQILFVLQAVPDVLDAAAH